MKNKGFHDSAEMKLPQDDKTVLAVYEQGNDFLNQKAEDGELFFLQTRTKASSATRVFVLKTGAKKVHLSVFIQAGLASTIDFYEDVTISTPGTKQVLRNYNRNYPDDGLALEVYAGATFSGGIDISPNQAGFGSNPGQASSGVSGDVISYILKPNKNYAYSVAPASSTDTLARSIAWEANL